jgi:hypothetical protein
MVLHIILTVCMLFVGCEKPGSTIKQEQKLERSVMNGKEVKPPGRSIPAIDAVKAAGVETATFALG